MSIKSDRWIRRMAEQQGMITPFEAGQVKTATDGHRIVSYGTSSYGYDVRCAREFKIFTNINSTIVDPKAFDPSSFVDIQADVCIIPPNSFALARTVEFFRIPRDTLVVCLGKSTYARCGIIVNVTPPQPRCPPRFMPVKAWRKCCSSSPMRVVKPRTRIAVENIRARPA
jgi:dCTP deaminase